MFKLNVVFITLLGVSVASNVFFYKNKAATSKLLTQSEQTEKFYLIKNKSLASQISAMQASNIKSQRVTDALQKELFALNEKSKKNSRIIKEGLKNAPCYREPIIYTPTLSLHYD